MPYVCKRILDIILAMGALIVSSPLFCFCILMTYWQMGRPIFFTQDRLGKGGEIFKIWKFRTMIDGAINQGLGLNVAKDDHRITRIGNLLRNLGIDELEIPKFLNFETGNP